MLVTKDSNMTKNIKIGDVFEIHTDLGLCYGQLTHRHPTHTDVLRIFKPKLEKRPSDFSYILNQEVEHTVLCNVAAGFKSGILERVASKCVRIDLQPFPNFRNSNRSPQEPENDDWWIWNGETETRVGKLSTEQMKYPRMAIRNFASIKSLIEGKIHPSLI